MLAIPLIELSPLKKTTNKNVPIIIENNLEPIIFQHTTSFHYNPLKFV